MKTLKFILIILTPLLFVSGAAAQLDDWSAVQSLPYGTKIQIQLRSGHMFGHCAFDGATNDQLACVVGSRFWFHRETFPRTDIKAVFRTHNGTLIGMGIGAGAGAAIGASRDTCCRGASALLGAVSLGAVGALIGTAADPFFHGKAVYRSPNSSPAKPPNPPPTPHSPNVQSTPPPQPHIPCLRDGATLQCLNPQSLEPVP